MNKLLNILAIDGAAHRSLQVASGAMVMLATCWAPPAFSQSGDPSVSQACRDRIAQLRQAGKLSSEDAAARFYMQCIQLSLQIGVNRTVAECMSKQTPLDRSQCMAAPETKAAEKAAFDRFMQQVKNLNPS